MAHRLVSSKRDTKNASAASCRHMMVLPWKCRSVLPTSWVISWTSHEKGSFRIRSSVLFWYRRISQRATVPGQYFLVFLTFPAFRNSFHGALPPMVGQSFLQAGSFSEADGLASAAIWANCRVGNNDSHWPTSSSLLASSTCLYYLLQHLHHLPCGWGVFGWGGVVHKRGGLFSSIFSFLTHLASHLLLLASSLLFPSCLASLARWVCSPHVCNTVLPSLSFLGVVLVLAMLIQKMKKESCSQRKWLPQGLIRQTEKNRKFTEKIEKL